jgi:hypothetical protein
MPVYTETLLVIDSGRKSESIPVKALAGLGYRNIAHANFDDLIKAYSAFPRLDALIVYWRNELPADAVSLSVRAVMSGCECEAAVMISPFCTKTNIEAFRAAGISAWVTVPFTRRDLDARLRYALEGERRRLHMPVLVERRRQSPIPAFA